MDQTMILVALSVLIFLLFLLIFTRIYSKKLKGTPREAQSFHLKLFYVFMPLYLLLTIYGVHQKQYLLALVGIMGIISYAQMAFKKQTGNDITINYARDPKHCGRCEYDLTGNVSGVCPECGWSIPQGSVQYERPEWAYWWKQWSIDYLDNWKKKRNSVTFWIVAFATLGVGFFLYTGDYTAFVFPFIISLVFVIQLIRIIAYGRRQH